MNKFTTLLEGVQSRYTNGGFLCGDLVKLKSGALSHAWVKKLGGNTLEKLKEFTETDLNIRVSAVKALRPAVSGSVQPENQVDDFYCDIVRETAPGLYHDFITIPAELLEYIDPGINLAPVPDSLKRKQEVGTWDKVEIKDSDDPMNPVKQTAVKEGDKELPSQNTKLPGVKEPVDNFSTRVYMGNL